MFAPESRPVAITPSLYVVDLGRPQHEIAAIEIAVNGQFVRNTRFGPNVAAVLLTERPFAVADMLLRAGA